MVSKFLLSAALLAGLSTPLCAQTIPNSGGYFQAACRSLASNSGDEPNEFTLTSFYCGQDIDLLSGMGRFLGQDSRFCKPADVSIPQMAGVAAGYLDAHKDQLGEPFLTLAAKAFHDRWPCS